MNVNIEIPIGLRSFGNKLGTFCYIPMTIFLYFNWIILIINLLIFNKVGCSHGRAHEFFLESLSSNFPSVQCVAYSDLAQNKCTVSGVIENMGGDFAVTRSQPKGIFYLETKPEPPYAISDINFFKHADMVLPKKANGWLSRTLDVTRSIFHRQW